MVMLSPVVIFFINDVCVETQYSGHHIGRIKQLLYANDNLAANRGQSRGLFILDPNREASPIVADTCNQNRDRKTFCKKPAIHLKGYMELDICGINMWLLDLCTYRLALEVAPDNLVINAPTNDHAYRLKIQSLKLHCNRIKSTQAGFLNVSKMLQKSPLE